VEIFGNLLYSGIRGYFFTQWRAALPRFRPQGTLVELPLIRLISFCLRV
jgi:hypothetical protein